ncbi:hypothetical protein Q7C_2307 [Methylophaga frappieri]|uniref:Uncharacterized protein n=1 Tax=Methylophaga frappieri (strain ATCC BAA-2434 / DSM 25690 / JAM7) TaxID=754477 RepID=I1YKJ8_METFJ|nr:hypothetical protein Q7C_2307 [Methylophaga frappieri]
MRLFWSTSDSGCLQPLAESKNPVLATAWGFLWSMPTY